MVKAHALQLTHWKTTLKHLLVRYRAKCWKEYANIGLSGFAWNNLQTVNYMGPTIDSNKYFMLFSEFYVFLFLKNFNMALKKSPDKTADLNLVDFSQL